MIKTAESVSIAHPDKVCDQISDAVLDACLKQDPNTRSAIEVLGGHGIITVTGELTTKAHINIRKIAQEIYKDCGYEENIGVTVNVVEQSLEIEHGVDNDGAGDQGIMVGYATSETPELLPLEVVLARKLTKAMGKKDGKAQVTTENGKVISILTSVCDADYSKKSALVKVVKKEIEPLLVCGLKIKDVWLKNPNGEWSIGGFNADTGLTGRKLAVDNYGPNIPLGGGCFSGKDATKVDRSGAYIARKIAADYLKKRKAKEVYSHIAYAIGVAKPLMAVVTIDGKQEEIKGYDLRPSAIIKYLKLKNPQFRETAKYGHFGNGFSWDK
ncbi:MAG: methionine adenosyltransferase domain-containing protein [Parcubacteria group bacterium]|nr:methionine adenosyltransferase domain-containing protein [Parcubacteria group bacterium]